ncbi:Amidase [Mesorhizobium amorphae CCNWGS0123]|uniref:Amidase n=1 Tax=Mesorhizobium amorphae CCNWGS0123 TaxID=1082933 RepID=G6YIG3_9HYPH|nr:Amidase [Mesorhizobium amorphae CCNWGS0123]
MLPPLQDEIRAGNHPCLTFPTNTLIGSQTWLPSICLPAGFCQGIPVGLELLVQPYREANLFRLGYGFEQTTKYRRPPVFD